MKMTTWCQESLKYLKLFPVRKFTFLFPIDKSLAMHIQERIAKYIKGELSPKQVDDLWVEFIKTPEWYEYFITELHLTALIRGEDSLRVSEQD